MSTKLATTIIIVSSFTVEFLWGIMLGKESEKKAIQQKHFLIQQEVNKIG
jgi:hypothetical protein